MENVFFFQTQQIADDTNIFNQFKEQKIFFSYFQVDQNYYLFVYSQQSIDINFVYQSIDLIQELDSKQRKLRSFRGFFLYALEIIQNADNYQSLKTNLQPFFWKQVHNIIRQNKKGALLEFLFGSEVTRMGYTEATNSTYPSSSPALQELQNQIQSLHNKVDSLAQQVARLSTALRFGQQKVIQLESKLNMLSDPDKSPKSHTLNREQPDSTLKMNIGPYSLQNYPGDNLDSNTFPKDSKSDSKDSSTNEQYNSGSNQNKGLNEQNFITLSQIPDQEKIEIIQRGFQHQAESKISLKKYYESVSEANSLFQLKGYSIKYETIRRTKLYQQLKL